MKWRQTMYNIDVHLWQHKKQSGYPRVTIYRVCIPKDMLYGNNPHSEDG